jgi:hypothetical protein
MASHISFVISGLLLVIITIVVQSVPIVKVKSIIHTPYISNKQAVKQHLLKPVASVETPSTSASTTTSPTTTISQSTLSSSTITQETNDKKKKRYINDYDSQFDENDDSNSYELSNFKLNNNNKKIDHVLHPEIQEVAAKIHDNTDKLVDTDDSKVFSDIQMNPDDLIDIVRRRRDAKLNVETNQRRKRALSPYDFYDTDSLYNPYADLIDGHQYVRPVRAFAPLYWYPSVYERNIRAALAPSFYESSAWPKLYSSYIANNEWDETANSLFNDDDDDENDDEDENDYELNRYPILVQPSNNLFDNLQLQQQYNIDDLPAEEDLEENSNEDDDDDDDDEEEQQYRSFYQAQRPYNTRYGPIDTYF